MPAKPEHAVVGDGAGGDQRHQDDGRGVVEARLRLERAGQPPRQRHPPQHREHRGRVGRRGDRAEQHRELPAAGRAGSAPPTAITVTETATPTVASESPSRIAGRISRQWVVRPPSARITTSAAKPSACATLGVLERRCRARTRRAARPSAGRPAGWAGRPATETRTARIASSITAAPTSRNGVELVDVEAHESPRRLQGRRTRILSGPRRPPGRPRAGANWNLF